MVRLQTLDLRIGVRVPASQPHIPGHFVDSRKSLVRALLRGRCGFLRTRRAVVWEQLCAVSATRQTNFVRSFGMGLISSKR